MGVALKNTILLFSLVLIGCCRDPGKYHAFGYVRTIWCNLPVCYVVFEGDNKEIFTIRHYRVPPVWEGLHAEIEYEYDCDQEIYKNLRVVRRLE